MKPHDSKYQDKEDISEGEIKQFIHHENSASSRLNSFNWHVPQLHSLEQYLMSVSLSRSKSSEPAKWSFALLLLMRWEME